MVKKREIQIYFKKKGGYPQPPFKNHPRFLFEQTFNQQGYNKSQEHIP